MVWVHVMYLPVQASIRGALARCEEENALGYFGLKVEKNSTAPTCSCAPVGLCKNIMHTLVAADCQLMIFALQPFLDSIPSSSQPT